MSHYHTKNAGMTFGEITDAFIRSRKLGNGGANKPNAERTMFEYRYDLNTFFKYFSDREYYNELTEVDVLRFLEAHQNRNLADASKKKVLRSLRAFFRWLEKDGECRAFKSKPWQGLLPKIGANKPRLYVPTPQVMGEFLHAFDKSTIWGLRDFVVTSIMIDCGPRIGEVCNLDLSSVLWDQSKMIVNGKTGPRVIPLNQQITVPQLRRWIRERERFTTSTALFITKFGGRCTPNTFDQAFDENRKGSGVGITEEGTLTPHTVRHYFCTHYLVNGGTLPMLQAITGHTSLATLQLYLHMAMQFSSVAQEHTTASPLRSLTEGNVKRRKMR